MPQSIPARVPVSKGVRFAVFHRDNFTCRYCGRQPPAVILECDHVIPVARGGSNDEDNLATACFDCNRGKGVTMLSSVPDALSERIALMREAEDQVNEFRSLLDARKEREEADAWRILDALHSADTVNAEWLSSITTFSRLLGFEDVLDSASLSLGKPWPHRWRYFCGVCWTKHRRAQV